MAKVTITLEDIGPENVRIVSTPSMKQIFGLDANGTGLTLAQGMAAYMCRMVSEKLQSKDATRPRAARWKSSFPKSDIDSWYNLLCPHSRTSSTSSFASNT